MKPTLRRRADELRTYGERWMAGYLADIERGLKFAEKYKVVAERLYAKGEALTEADVVEICGYELPYNYCSCCGDKVDDVVELSNYAGEFQCHLCRPCALAAAAVFEGKENGNDK